MRVLYGWFVWALFALVLVLGVADIAPDVFSEDNVVLYATLMIAVFGLLIAVSANEIKHLVHPFRKIRKIHYKRRAYSRWA